MGEWVGEWVGGRVGGLGERCLAGICIFFSRDLPPLDASTHNSPQISAPQTGASRYSGLFPLAGGPRWRGRPSEGSLRTRPSSW